MNRQRAKELLVDYLNGHLIGEAKEQLEELLNSDDELQLEAEAMRREMLILRSSVADPIEEARLRGISTRVMNELRRRREGSLKSLSLPWRSYLRASVVVLLVVLGVLLFFVLKPGDVEPGSGRQTLPATAAGAEPAEAESGPRAIRMSFATSDPKVRIYWTFSENFELDEGE